MVIVSSAPFATLPLSAMAVAMELGDTVLERVFTYCTRYTLKTGVLCSRFRVVASLVGIK